MLFPLSLCSGLAVPTPMSPHLLSGPSNDTEHFFWREFKGINEIMTTKHSDFSNKWCFGTGFTARAWTFLNLQGHVMQKAIHSLAQTERFQGWEELGELKYECVRVGF